MNYSTIVRFFIAGLLAFGATAASLQINLDKKTRAMVVEDLKFHTEELPQLAEAGARYVVVACCGTWRDGEVTSSVAHIGRLERELRKRFMNRINQRSG